MWVLGSLNWLPCVSHAPYGLLVIGSLVAPCIIGGSCKFLWPSCIETMTPRNLKAFPKPLYIMDCLARFLWLKYQIGVSSTIYSVMSVAQSLNDDLPVLLYTERTMLSSGSVLTLNPSQL